jgi:xylulokinase
MTEALGGNEKIARLTGSIATERFAGPQIRKFWKTHPDQYRKTAHIALVSSFLTSLLIGRIAPVDAGDGYGTNLADIRSGTWNEDAVNAAAPRLLNRLPRLVVKDQLVGQVSSYLAERFGFEPDTQVVVGSGDNPCSLVGLGLMGVADIHAVSLGTSDTYFGYLKELEDRERSEGHIFGASDGRFMFLICFKNGSFARDAVRNQYGLSWDEFSRILLETLPGNHGKIMLPYVLPEITPLVMQPGILRFGGLAADDVPGNVRAVAEAQAMAMYLHSDWTGSRPKRLLVTAGGSENRGLLTVISQVFGAEVHSFEVKESAALGAAMRAAHGFLSARDRSAGWRDLFESIAKPVTKETIRPSAEAVKAYQAPDSLVNRYRAWERSALKISS